MKITKWMRVLLVALSIVMVLPLFACDKDEEETTTTTGTTQETESETTATTAEESTSAETTADTTESTTAESTTAAESTTTTESTTAAESTTTTETTTAESTTSTEETTTTETEPPAPEECEEGCHTLTGYTYANGTYTGSCSVCGKAGATQSYIHKVEPIVYTGDLGNVDCENVSDEDGEYISYTATAASGAYVRVYRTDGTIATGQYAIIRYRLPEGTVLLTGEQYYNNKEIMCIMAASSGNSLSSPYVKHMGQVIADGEWHDLVLDLSKNIHSSSGEYLPNNKFVKDGDVYKAAQIQIYFKAMLNATDFATVDIDSIAFVDRLCGFGIHENTTSQNKPNPVDGHTLTCEDCGAVEEHVNTTVQDKLDGTHDIVCDDCEAVLVNAAAHTPTDFTLEDGTYKGTCSVCEAEVIQDYIYKVEPIIGDKGAVTATQGDGYITYTATAASGAYTKVYNTDGTIATGQYAVIRYRLPVGTVVAGNNNNKDVMMIMAQSSTGASMGTYVTHMNQAVADGEWHDLVLDLTKHVNANNVAADNTSFTIDGDVYKAKAIQIYFKATLEEDGGYAGVDIDSIAFVDTLCAVGIHENTTAQDNLDGTHNIVCDDCEAELGNEAHQTTIANPAEYPTYTPGEGYAAKCTLCQGDATQDYISKVEPVKESLENVTATTGDGFITYTATKTTGASARVYKNTDATVATGQYAIIRYRLQEGTVVTGNNNNEDVMKIIATSKGKTVSTDQFVKHMNAVVADGAWHYLVLDLSKAADGSAYNNFTMDDEVYMAKDIQIYFRAKLEDDSLAGVDIDDIAFVNSLEAVDAYAGTTFAEQ